MALHPNLIPILRRDYYSFAKRAFSTLNGEELKEAPYLEYVASQLACLADGTHNRLVLNMPSRTLKSQLGSIMLSAYILGRSPRTRILILTYSERLAGKLSRGVRKLLRRRWFQQVFPSCSLERSEEMDFETSAGGGLLASSVEGGITGQGADLIIIDDPVQIRHAADLDRLKYVNDLFDGEIRSRLDNKSEGRILIIAHRLNEDDLTGHVLRQGGWHHIALPLVARRDVHYLLPSGVWHRQKGDTLRPDSYTKKEVEHLRKTDPNFEALYQQNTRPARLARIKASHFGTFAREDLPPEPMVLSVDPAGAAGSDNSFTVIQAWVSDKERHYLLDQWRQQADYQSVKKALRRFFNKYNPAALVIERTAFGTALAASRRYGEIVKPVIPDGRSKLERLAPYRKLIRNGKIVLLGEAPFAGSFIEEIVNFEVAQFTDQVDALTQYLDFMSTNPPLVSPVRGGLGAGAYGSLPRVQPSLTPEQTQRMHRTAVLTPGIDRRNIDAQMDRIAAKYRFGGYYLR
jgi:predicted phage terminase large subunit-like protein